MFNLEKAITSWRKDLEKHPGLEPGYVEELESHLRDKIETLQSKGMDDKEAFNEASARLIDQTEALAEEFHMARRSRADSRTGAALLILLPNYLKVALRQLYRQKGYSVISIAGLSIGLACCLLILMFVLRELSYDSFHTRSDRIYRLVNMSPTAGRPGIAKVNGPWGYTALENIPEVEEMVRFVPFSTPYVEKGEQANYEIGGLYADPSVFEVMSYSFLSGDPETALEQPGSIVLTESFAKIYFGNKNPVGKTLLFNGSEEFTVTAVIEDVPANTHIPFRFLGSMASLNHPDRDDWIRWNQFYTYLLLKRGASPEAAARKFTDLLPRYIGEEAAENYRAALQPITEIHLESKLWRELRPNSDIAYVYLFSGVAFLILLIACVNVMNLATARALNRLKEVGIRKAAGAARSSLVAQFLGESLIYAGVSALFAVGLALAMLDTFSRISGQTFLPSDLLDLRLMLGLLMLILIMGLLTGSYPALFMSGFKPIESLKGNVRITGNNLIRQGLVVFQFAIAGGLILATIAVMNQLEFMQQKNLGFDRERLVIIPIRDDSMKFRSQTVKQELLRIPAVRSVSVAANFPGGTDYGIPTQPEGVPDDQRPGMRILAVDYDFIDTFGMKIAEGRTFSEDISTDRFGAVIINREAARQLGWEEPLGKRIGMEGIEFGPAPVIGVLEDFHFRSMREPIGPIMLFIPPPEWYSYYIVSLHPGNPAGAIGSIEKTWNGFDAVHPFTSVFFDEYYRSLYRQERDTQRMLRYFTFLAVLLSSLGLFGIASFVAEKRTKEVGIRKVLGASTTEVVMLLARQFTGLVAVALLIGLPLSFFGINRWLSDYAYRTEIGWMTVAVTAAGSFVVAWISVSYQSVKAALTNPVNTLRSE